MTTPQDIRVRIREETAPDIRGIKDVNEQAFAGTEEATIIDALRSAGAVTLSLVAVVDGEVVGHLLCSPVSINRDSTSTEAVGLGPMAVAAKFQRMGIGSRLVDECLRRLRQAGHSAVVLVGHPAFYPRFGFVPASRFGLHCEFECPDEAFMALELQPGSLAHLEGGVVHFRPEFSE